MSTFKECNATGCFKHRETGCWFDFRPTQNEWALQHGLPHEVSVGDVVGYPFRFAKVLGTVAYVAVDENEYGPVIEKWAIKMWWRKE
jgi:hypothetical protein